MNHKKNYEDYLRYAKSLRRQKTKEAYFELHHIFPKSLFPELSDLKEHPENGVLLTPREHYLAHYLLTKIYPESEEMKICFWMMSRKNTKSLMYHRMKNELIEIFRQKSSGCKNPMYRKNSLEGKSEEEIRIIRQKQSQSMKGKNTGKRSLEVGRKISSAKMGKYRGEECYRSKRVRCVETGKEYISYQEAAIQLGHGKCIGPKIGQQIRGERKKVFGFHWELC